MRYAVVTPEGPRHLPGLLRGAKQEYARCVTFTERWPRQIRESIPLVIGALMAMSWHIAYCLAHH